MAESPIIKWMKENGADLFNTAVNAGQIASSLKKRPASTESASETAESTPQKKAGIGAYVSNTDEVIVGQLMLDLSAEEQRSLQLFFNAVPPQGNSAIRAGVRRINKEKVRHFIVNMDIVTADKIIRATRKGKDDKTSVVRERKQSTVIVDHRMRCLQAIATEVNGNEQAARDLYQRWADIGLLPGDLAPAMDRWQQQSDNAKKWGFYVLIVMTLITIAVMMLAIKM